MSTKKYELGDEKKKQRDDLMEALLNFGNENKHPVVIATAGAKAICGTADEIMACICMLTQSLYEVGDRKLESLLAEIKHVVTTCNANAPSNGEDASCKQDS